MTASATTALDPVFQTLSPLALQVRRVTESVVGRAGELSAIQQEMVAARAGMSCVTVEGEPGIGKTRLLLWTAEVAASEGFVSVAVTADEELRGPFLLARSILAAPAVRDVANGTLAMDPIDRALDAVSGRTDPGLEGLPPDDKLLRAFDLCAMALQALASERPVALLVDDVQWADEDSLRMLRYVVRTVVRTPMLLVLALRPEEMALVTEALTLIADMERMGLVRRLRLGRFTQVETTEFVGQLLGGTVDLASGAVMHAQAEGVPFIVEELAHAYRDAGMIQQIDGRWTLSRGAERLVPSAVHTLIQRRANRLPDTTRGALAEAAVLGRTFSLRDLGAIRTAIGDDGSDPVSLAEALAPAVTAGLLVQHPEGAAADYSFSHDQVREFSLGALTPPRRRAIHAAIVDMLVGAGDPSPASLPLLAHHALAAGDTDRGTRFTIEGARAAAAAHAPEEALRLVELALPSTSGPSDRMELLSLRDQALDMVRRPGDRLEGLAELAALAEALGDSHVELEVMLRRAAALRLSREEDQAATLARRVRELAAERGDPAAELAACLELGQDLLRAALGEGYVVGGNDVDAEGADETFRRAAALAEELGDEASLAAALRELGTICTGRVRSWFVEQIMAGPQFELEILSRVAGGERTEDILHTFPVAPFANEAMERFERALEIYERLGDRRGVMSTIIAQAFISWAPDIHITSAAHRIEEIRRLATRMKSFTTQSEQALADVQMLYGVHVYARAKVVPDLELSRGEEAYRAARALGDRSLEFLAAGGVALAHLKLGEVEEAETWLGKAAAAAQAAPTPVRARQLESWRGVARAVAGDAPGMRRHLERSLAMATDEGRPAARCEALARLALEAAALGAREGDEELIALAERSALEAKDLGATLPGHPPWGAQADAALAQVRLARGDAAGAAEAGRAVVAALQAALHEDMHLDILLPTARAFEAGGTDEERAFVREYLRLGLTTIAQRTLDEDVRVRWFRGPMGRELAAVTGPVNVGAPTPGPEADPNGEAAMAEEDLSLLRLLTEGKTNREMAEELSIDEDAIVRRLAQLYAKVGASSRAGATTFAFRKSMV